MMISAVIVNFNQADKLKDCLQSIRNFADEIVVIDLGSTDDSEEITKKFGGKFIPHKFEPYVELVRNDAISYARGGWILVLDPDETITADLSSKLKEVSQNERYVAVNIPRKNIFFNKWIAHTNWWPDRHVRFFKKQTVVWSDQIHLYPQVNGDILDLEAKEELAIIHHGYSSIRQFIDRQNRYSTIEAENRHKTGEKFSWINLFWWPKREFLVRLIKHQGYLDGFHGFALTILMMIYRLMVVIKMWELEKDKK